MVDRLKIQKLLQALSTYNDLSLLESVIHDQVNLVLPRPLSTVEFQETLSFCRDKGFISFRTDTLGDTRWFITNAGSVQLLRG